VSYEYIPGRTQTDDILGMDDVEAETALARELQVFTTTVVEDLVMVPRRERAAIR
jgi:hypothetical protein